MSAQPVEAVWVWYFGTAAQKATYGRFLSDVDKSYSKDFLQASGDCSALVDAVLPMPTGADTLDITYKWVGGSAPGSIKHPNDRHHFRWGTIAGAPAPWRLTSDPDKAGPGTIPGDPTRTATIADANSALGDYAALGLNSYLVAVKLVGERDVLHIRAYVENAPSDLSWADTDQLPGGVQALVHKAIPSNACASARFHSGGVPLTLEVEALIAKLQENPTVLLIGPPGTGKTVLLEKLARYIEEPAGGLAFDPDKNHDAWSESEASTEPGKTRTVVFHPSYSYDNLVVGLLPTVAEGGVVVKPTPGPLVNLAQYASGGASALLVLDEFNRGNAAAILGDAIALLDRDKRGTAHIDLPYGDLGIEVPGEFAGPAGTTVDPRFSLPPSLWIVAAMNSSDRSVAPLDAALRRRFTIIEVPPDYDALASYIGADLGTDLGDSLEDWGVGHVGHLAVSVLRALNERIGAVLGRDFELGQSNFWHVGGTTVTEALGALARAWDERITHTLRLALQDDDDSLAVILKAGRSDQAVVSDSVRAAWWKAADPALGSYARARLQFNQLSGLSLGDVTGELRRLAEV